MERLNSLTRLTINKGQSLVELLIGMGLAVVVMITAMALLQFLLRMSAQDPVVQTGAFLGHETMRAVSAIAEGSWPAIASASQGGPYHVEPSPNGFVLKSNTPGTGIITINAVPYTVAVTVQPVNRAATNEISQSGIDDPSTKKIITTISWTQQGRAYSNTLERYVARTRNEVSWQTNWVGGPMCPTSDAPVAGGAVTTQFCRADTTIDYTTMPGSIKIKGL